MKRKPFEFGTRRIIGINYTRYLALPKFWLKNCGLEKGDFVQVTLGDDGSLVLRPVVAKHSKKRVAVEKSRL